MRTGFGGFTSLLHSACLSVSLINAKGFTFLTDAAVAYVHLATKDLVCSAHCEVATKDLFISAAAKPDRVTITIMLNREAFKKSIPVLAARVAAVSVDTLRKRIDR